MPGSKASPKKPRLGAAAPEPDAAAPDPVRPESLSPARLRRRAAWAVLVYLAGDTDRGHVVIQADLDNILLASPSAELHLAVQHDGPGGTKRHLLTLPAAPAQEARRSLGRVDSGSAAALLDFLHWALAACPAEQVALVFGSPAVIGFTHDGRTPCAERVFALSRDQGSGHDLEAGDLGWVLREAQHEARAGAGSTSSPSTAAMRSSWSWPTSSKALRGC